jgi:hypothetical protein
MSRITTPAEVDIPAVSRPAWLDLNKAMSTSLDAATRQRGAHAVEEVNA